MKKAVIILLFITLILQSFSVFSFSVLAQEESGAYIKGYDNGTFKPDNNITRAEAVTTLLRIISNEEDIKGKYTSTFQDVASSDWFYDNIAYFENMGYLKSYTETFLPNKAITREEFVELMVNISGISEKEDVSFTDVDISNPRYDAICTAASLGYVTGYPDGSFKPKGNITRAEAVTVINRFLKRTPTGNISENKFSDISGHWAYSQIICASSPETYNGTVIWTQEFTKQEPYIPMYNTYKLLKTKKNITVGFLGGSITNGYTASYSVKDGKASRTGGSAKDSWVNRTTLWLKSKFGATVNGINAGVSDTATNFGIYRLSSALMNEDGHDMPDLVFIEFTSNDWTYDTQSKADLERQAESLILNIWSHNPYADIVVVSTATNTFSDSRLAHKKIAEYYNLPFVDVGTALQDAKIERGASQESDGTYYYTVDNLHPSAQGYKVYLDETKKVLSTYFDSFKLSDSPLSDNLAAAPLPMHDNLILSPSTVCVEDMQIDGSYNYAKANILNVVPSQITVLGDTTVSCTFNGTTLGFIFNMTTSSFKIRYTIDDEETKEFRVDNRYFAWQRYDHPQVFMIAHELEDCEHTLKLEFIPDPSTMSNIRFGGLLTNSEQ